MECQSKQKINFVGNSVYCTSSRVRVPFFVDVMLRRHTQSKRNLDFV